MFQYQNDRFSKIENKANSVITINGILFAIINFWTQNYLFYPTSIFLLCSIFLSFKVFNLKKGKVPHDEYDNFYKYVKLKATKILDQFILNYMGALKTEERINNKKTNYLKSALFFSKLAWVSFVLALIFIGLLNLIKTHNSLIISLLSTYSN